MMHYCTLVLALVVSFCSAERVPVMMWTNDESALFPPVLAGHTVSTSDFARDYVDKFSGQNKNLVVFVQDKLSIADISHYANIYGYEDEKDSIFPNVKMMMGEQTSSHLPNVISPVSVFEAEGRVVRVLQAPYNVEDLLTSSGSDSSSGEDSSSGQNLGLILVKLNDLQGTDYQKSLKENDKIIGDTIKALERHNVKYTALYTAVSSSKKIPIKDFQVAKAGATGRQLLADSSSEGSSNSSAFFSVDDSIYLYLGGLSISNTSLRKDGTDLDLSKLTMDSNSSCSNQSSRDSGNSSTCAIKLNYGDSEPLKDLSLMFSFTQSSTADAGYWYISDVELSYTNQSDSGSDTSTVPLNVAPIGSWSPLGFSFSCNEPAGLGPRNKTQKSAGSGPYLFISQIQVQAYGRFINGGFGYYNDCEPFFTVGIWMALLCMAVMIGILVFGLYMLCQITTMDRFDDPKGKTIIVAAAAD